MLYVFHVDTGRMIKFDMNVALTSVQNLKEIIENRHGLPAANVVLLVSGGEMLTPNSLVCSYSAGTDTNPIYMFSTIDVKPQPWPSIEPGHFSDDELSQHVERCIILPATYSTVVTRAQLAQQMYDLAREEETICETLVHEQHLQQQGWAAVIANMEDLTDEFRQRFNHFSACFSEHLLKRDEHLELLKNFEDDLTNLSKIPILPGLLQNAEEEFHGFDEYLDNDEVFSRSQQNESMILQSNNNSSRGGGNNTENGTNNNRTLTTSSSGSGSVVEQKRPRLSKENTPDTVIGGGSSKSDDSVVGGGGGSSKAVISGRNLTLLQWISAKENHNTLKVMAAECKQGLATFDTEKYESMKEEVLKIIGVAEQSEIKEIKGLEDRLSQLEKLMFELKKLVQDQKEHSTAFQQNQSRASSVGDSSILPDLCVSHRNQLKAMLSSQKKIRDYRRRIKKAKDELGSNLNKRLKYIVHIENTMSDLDNNLLFYHRCQRRVERHINIIQQIHQTPKIYVSAVTEVVRRRIFSGEFVHWASNLAFDFDAIHNEEIERRRQFNTNFEGHFLNTLFPGMNDMPPAFANENPLAFDACLPNITKTDIDVLATFLPDLSSNIQLPDMGNVIEFFVSRSGNKNTDVKMISTNQNESVSGDAETTGTILSHRPIDLHAHLKDGFESETDTEEFEKVGGQSATEKQLSQHQQSPLAQEQIIQTISIATSTSENDKPEMHSTSIETEPIITHTVETLTEINQPKSWSTSLSTLAPPKKPPRKLLNLSNYNTIAPAPQSSYLFSSNHNNLNSIQLIPKLPVILEKEIHINTGHNKISYSNNSTINNMGHHHTVIEQHDDDYINILSPTPISPQHSSNDNNNKFILDNEFINSEFYIDESLPSSLNEDEDDCSRSRLTITNTTTTTSIDDGDEFRNFCQKSECSEVMIQSGTNLTNGFNTRGSLETVFGLLQENLGSRQIEVERLKILLKNMSQVSYQCIELLKNNLKSIKSDHNTATNDIHIKLKTLSDTWNKVQHEYETREREQLEKLQLSHEHELQNLRESLVIHQLEYEKLKLNINAIESSHMENIECIEKESKQLRQTLAVRNEEIEQLQNVIKLTEAEKEKCLAELCQKLTQEHKTELESLRCRFKLMTSMERSPSDTSLEKIEKPDMIEIACHESIISQIKEDFTVEKDKAIRAALDMERFKWEQFNQTLNISPNSVTAMTANMELLKRMVEERDKQLEMMRERELMQSKEIYQLKLKFDVLTNEEESDKGWMKEKIEYLNRDKNRLELELSSEKLKRKEMESSVATMRGSTLDQSCMLRSKSSSSQYIQGNRQCNVMIETCVVGDLVFVVWNIRHGQFIIVQESPVLFFVHGDSLASLNLRLPLPGDTEIPVPFFTIAKVVHKEYCQARKEENRYKVTKGTKFYRVKVLPITEMKWHSRREKLEFSRSTSTQHITDSFAQTESPNTSGMRSSTSTGLGSSVSSSTATATSSKDMVDSVSLKERTVSVTSITEDDEPISLLSERCRYISVSEADEMAVSEQPSSLNTKCVTPVTPPSVVTNKRENNSVGFFTLIEPLISPLQIEFSNLDICDYVE